MKKHYSLTLSHEAMSWLAGSTNGVNNFSFLQWMLSGMAPVSTVIDIRGNKVTLQPGETNGSVNSCSLHFNLDRAVIREVYAQMQAVGLIRIVPCGRVTTLLNMVCASVEPKTVLS